MAYQHTPPAPFLTKLQRGFTLVELLVVIAIVAILAGLAAPSFKSVIDKLRVESNIEEMINTFYYARSEAAKRRDVVIRKSCSTGPANNWGDFCGWEVATDANGNGVLDAGIDELLKVFPAPINMNVTHNRDSSSIVLDVSGQIPPDSFTFSPKPEGLSSPHVATLCLSSGGRIRIQKNSPTC